MTNGRCRNDVAAVLVLLFTGIDAGGVGLWKRIMHMLESLWVAFVPCR